MSSFFSTETEQALDEVTKYMKVLSHRSRLIVMCKVTRKPHSVSELIELTGMSQTALSHQLAKLREEKMVKAERKGKEIYYSIANQHLADLVEYICCKFQTRGNSE